MITAQHIDQLRGRLESEKNDLIHTLKSLGKIQNDHGLWVYEHILDTESAHDADMNIQADYKETMLENEAETSVLENRYADVMHALAKIDNGSYGICEISGEPIEQERLEADPTARTCIAHKESHL